MPHDADPAAPAPDDVSPTAAAGPSAGQRGETAGLKRRLVSASIWSFVAAGGGQLAAFGVFVLLARLLTPRDFGLVALAAVFIDLSRGVMLGGIPEALIQRKTWTDRVANTAFWLNVAAALVFSLVAVAAVLALENAGAAGPAGWVFVALTATLLIDGLRAAHEARLRREFAYKLLAARTIYATVGGGAAAVAAALAGWGVWSLVVNRLVVSGLQTALVWRLSDYRPALDFDRAEVRPLLAFSGPVLSARLLGQLNARLPDLLIGAIAGPSALGLYRVGSRSLYFLTQSIMTPLQTTTLSALSRLHDGAAVGRAYGRFTQLAAAVAFPMFIGSAVIAPDFVRVAFGEKWALSAPIMAVLAFSVGPQVLLFVFQPALQAIGRPGRAVASEMIRLWAGLAFVGGLAVFGPLAAAFGDVARRYVTTPQAMQVIAAELGATASGLLRGIAAPLLSALAMGGLVLVLDRTLLANAPVLARLVAAVALGALSYGVLMLTLGRRFTVDLLGSLRHGLPGFARRAADGLLRRMAPAAPVAAPGE